MRKVRAVAGPAGSRRAAVYLAAAIGALLLWPVSLLLLFADAIESLARMIPALRRQRRAVTWGGALLIFLVLGSVGAAADTDSRREAAAATPSSTAPPHAAAVSSPTPASTTAPPVPTPAANAAAPAATPGVAATASPVPTPLPSASSTPTPASALFVVARPANGDTVRSPSATVTFSGTSPAGANIVRDIFLLPDTTTVAGPDGKWSMPVELSEGGNDLTFRVGDDRSTEVKVSVNYVKTAPVARIGKPVTIDGIQITIRKVQWTTGSTYRRAPKGYVWVGYKITMKAVDESRVVSASDFTALADGTKQGEWTITGDEDWRPLLSLTELRAGASTTGWIAFEMPKPRKYIRLVYDPSFFSDEAKLTLNVKFP